ncbi:pyridoxal phosphate-dependent transferase [Leucosporidium creatinivorum]|uniref:sphinganine-1-phosphate aldolase n=1 Tax=Leucosporidium creatinivorum TaxID=106004 RepID=A0A1Y2G4E9_9BASI|nr:pyridoxal phosphate-dependent transferase [Leucosporidium creatinivorum]
MPSHRTLGTTDEQMTASKPSDLDQATLDIAAKVIKNGGIDRELALPEKGLSAAQVSQALAALSEIPNTKWSNGRVSGAVYHGGEDMAKIWVEAFSRFEVSNPLHADCFPGVRKMESEIVSMALTLFNSPLPSSAIDQTGGAGCTTSGGTESILMACKTYRDRARVEKGIKEPEMIIPLSAHAAFDKAGEFFGIKVHHVPVDEETRQVDVAQVAALINENTIFLVGSAPNFPDGAIDDIPALSELALKYDLGLHVDCCLGSFLVPFVEKAGYPMLPFDFRVPGVTSISCDTHKYGFAPKGSSIIMYRSKHLRSFMFSVMPTWPGGVYATTGVAGSRPGAIIAGAWASMQYMGIDGYLESCREIVGAAKAIVKGIKSDFPELYVLGNPLVSVVAFASKTISIADVGAAMAARGWHLNTLQHPVAIHIACTRLTVPAVDEFLGDLRFAVDSASPIKVEDDDQVALYGLGGSSEMKNELVTKMSKRYLDVLYS